MVTRQRTGSLKPRAWMAQLSTEADLEPTSFTQANQDPKWRAAMGDEFRALIDNGTWQLVPRPHSNRVLGNKWVFRLKKNPDGQIARYKARWVAKGYHQTEGVDYLETFCPVIKPACVRLILSIALSEKWPIKQLDVSNAFLHGTLEETVYMEQPSGFRDPQHPDHVCLLRRSLYGLKQAPRAWFSCLRDALLLFGFQGSKTDHSLFYYNSHGITMFVLMYVDDIILTGSHSSVMARHLEHLADKFKIKDLGPLHHFLGIEVTSLGDSLHLRQTKYINELLHKAGMSTSKPVTTPSSTTSLPPDATPFHNPTLYRQLVGGL
ncbi:Retrovirus-related Pol polyprotein from transposon RE1 [Linum perenne]